MGASEISHAQRRLWLHDRMLPRKAAYNLARTARLNGLLVDDALRRALNAVVQRHEVLRARFATDGNGEPVLAILPELKLTLAVEVPSPFPEGRRMQEARQRVRKEAQVP